MMARTIWLEEHADLEKYGNELLYKVNIRNQQSRAGIQYSRVSIDLRPNECNPHFCIMPLRLF